MCLYTGNLELHKKTRLEVERFIKFYCNMATHDDELELCLGSGLLAWVRIQQQSLRLPSQDYETVENYTVIYNQVVLQHFSDL